MLLSSKDSAEAFVEFEGGEDVIEDAMDKDRDSLQVWTLCSGCGRGCVGSQIAHVLRSRAAPSR